MAEICREWSERDKVIKKYFEDRFKTVHVFKNVKYKVQSNDVHLHKWKKRLYFNYKHLIRAFLFYWNVV